MTPLRAAARFLFLFFNVFRSTAMKRFVLTLLAAVAAAAFGTPAFSATTAAGSGPDHAEPGQCHARAFTPVRFETRTEQAVKVADASSQWRQILCEVNATPAKIREIQAALKAAGYNPALVDGVVRPATMHAVNQYQAAQGLPVDSYMNLATVTSLPRPACPCWPTATSSPSPPTSPSWR
jgi:Putative peptidoglycan binding domain